MAYLRHLVKEDYALAIAAFSGIFILKHAFCVPGGSLLNALAGALFGLRLAIPLCSLLTAVGGSCSYMLSAACGAPLIARWRLDGRIAPLRRRAEEARSQGSLPRLLLSLRLVPLLPQWLVNVASPHIGVPLPLFAATTALGLAPYCAVTCSAGATLAALLEGGGSLTASQLLPPHMLLLLCLCGCAVGLGPLLLQKLASGSSAAGGAGGAGGSSGSGSGSGSSGSAAGSLTGSSSSSLSLSLSSSVHGSSAAGSSTATAAALAVASSLSAASSKGLGGSVAALGSLLSSAMTPKATPKAGSRGGGGDGEEEEDAV